MNEVPTQPAAARPSTARFSTGGWLMVLCGAALTAVLLGAPLWVPEWEPFVHSVALACMALASVALGVVFVRVRSWLRPRVLVQWFLLANVVGGLALAFAWCVAALASMLIVFGSPFAPTRYKTLEFPEYDATLYLYDSTFLDPETTVYLRQGWLPLRKRLPLAFGEQPASVEVVQHGSVLMLNGQALDLAAKR